jgi:hypothetical protein
LYLLFAGRALRGGHIFGQYATEYFFSLQKRGSQATGIIKLIQDNAITDRPLLQQINENFGTDLAVRP